MADAGNNILVIPLFSSLETKGDQYSDPGKFELNERSIAVRYLQTCRRLAGWDFAIHVNDTIYRRQVEAVNGKRDDQAAHDYQNGGNSHFAELTRFIREAPEKKILVVMGTGYLVGFLSAPRVIKHNLGGDYGAAAAHGAAHPGLDIPGREIFP